MIKLILITIFLIILLTLINKKFYILIIQNILLILSIFLILLIYKTNYNWLKIYYILSIDNFSLILIILSIWILRLSLIASNKILINKFNKRFIIIIYLLILILLILFTSINLIIFYIFFELRLIPLLLIIIGWGIQINRIEASIYIIFYTLFGSLPFLIFIILIYYKNNSLIFNIIIINNYNYLINFFIYIILISAFLIKIPIYFLHLWLPKAHVQAPISGSIILAGIILKLGRYGLIRCLLIFPKIIITFNIYIILIRIIRTIYASLICLLNLDIKIIVAYSSVVHIGILISRILTISHWRIIGSIIIIISHGLCSSGIFCLVNLNYEKLHSRNLLINKGLIIIFPSITIWWFLLCSSNFSAPPSLNLFREIILFNSLILWNNILIIILFITSLIRTSYSIYLFSFSQFGKLFNGKFNFKPFFVKDYLIIILHWIPLNFIFLNLNIFY